MNDFSGHPWVVDTPGATAEHAVRFRARLIRWVSKAANAGDDVLVTDTADRNKWESVAAGANHVEADHIESNELWEGLKVPTLDSGKLYIYWI